MMTAQQFPRFDIHQHFGSLLGVPGASYQLTASLERDCQTRLEFMDSFGVQKAAIMPGHSYSAPGGLRDIMAINDGLYAYGQTAPDRFPALFGTLDPRHVGHGIAEVERMHAMGFKGVSWHPRFQGLPMDHPTMIDVMGRMAELGMVSMCHCYAAGDFESPWRLRRLVERFPGMTFVALDAMTSLDNLEQLIVIAEENDNLLIDMTSTTLAARGILWAIERVGADKLVYGSNYYSMSRVERVTALDAVDEAGLDEAQRRLVLGENALRALGLAG